MSGRRKAVRLSVEAQEGMADIWIPFLSADGAGRRSDYFLII
ncbi:MAG: hypothetical protein ACK5UY_02825 [Holosporales bacterium]